MVGFLHVEEEEEEAHVKGEDLMWIARCHLHGKKSSMWPDFKLQKSPKKNKLWQLLKKSLAIKTW